MAKQRLSIKLLWKFYGEYVQENLSKDTIGTEAKIINDFIVFAEKHTKNTITTKDKEV